VVDCVSVFPLGNYTLLKIHKGGQPDSQ
jgi:hypothetical protein